MKKKNNIFQLTPAYVYEEIQLRALESVLLNNLPYFERKVKRWFSREFSTPLPEVEKLNWDYILTHYYESNLENKTFNEVFDSAVSHYLPEFIEDEEKSNQEFAKSLLKEQKQTIENKRKTTQSLEEKDQEQEGDAKPQPKEVSLSFDEDDPTEQ